MAKLYNLARMTTATTGTGTIALGAAVSGYLSFAQAGLSDGDIVSYGINDGTNSEVGTATYAATATTLTRAVTKSTNSDAAINLSGTAQVFITPREEDLLQFDAAMSLTAAQQSQARANLGIVGRNKIINGGFTINQRGYVSAATLASGSYGHDRWKAGASGGDYGFTQLIQPTQIAIAAGKSLIQVVENVNIEGGAYTLSWTGTATARVGINSVTPSGTFAVSPITVTGQTAGTTMSVEFTGANAAGTNAVATNTGTIGTVQLEPGAQATAFEFRLYAQELAYCQRYFTQIGKALWCSGFNTTSVVVGASFPVAMRASPTISNPVALTVHDLPVGLIAQSGANQINAGPYVDTEGFYLGIGGFSGITAYRPYGVNIGYVLASSEL